MFQLWTTGGLSAWELARRTARESWEDSVFGQGGRMAFYHFLALFPALTLLLVTAARDPHLAGNIRSVLLQAFGRVFPRAAAELVRGVIADHDGRTFSNWQWAITAAGTLWAALNSTWAMVYGLNRAYEVEESRTAWRLGLTIVGLTASMAVTACAAMALVFYSTRVGGAAWLEWALLAPTLWVSFAVLYRFAPNLRDHKWRWSIPGAFCAVTLWLGATFTAQVYFERVNDYARSYGRVNGVAMLLLWLYVTNGAVLIGGEMNSEIEKAVTGRPDSPPRRRGRN